jgi:hypothetical protein
MKNLPVRLFVIALFVANIALGFSSLTSNPALSCLDALRRTPQAWSDLLTRVTNDTSELRQDQAAKTWADCKSVSNQALLKSRPTSKARLNKLSALEFQFMKDETDLASGGSQYNPGSGTLYRHGFARFQTDLALHLETMIVVTGSKAGAKQSASISKRYKSAKMIIEARLKKVKTLTPSIPDGSSASVIADRKKQWTTTAKHYKLTYNSILKLIGTRINEASMLELEFLAKGIFAENLGV